MSDEATLRELGKRLLQYRLNKNMTQAELAREAGVSSRTINRVEHGHSTQLANFLRLLKGLNLSQNLDALIPEPAVSPIQQMKLLGKVRKRASSSTKQQGKTWSWEDDE